MTLKHLRLRTSVMAVASCLALSVIPLAAHAAGLGKIVVLSALGQALRAEIEVTATREELADMKAQLASPDAFKQAGLDYATSLLSIRFSLDKRANGQSVIRLSSDKPINDPFVDMLLELNWPTGRLVREYTFLLDPPEIAPRGAAPVASAIARPAPAPAVSRPPAGTRAPTPIDDEVRSKAAARVGAQQAAPAPVDQSATTAETRQVRRGDTLNKIASETRPEGVSLEQMLVGLLRANQDAFDGGNMNRLKAGKILTLPEKSAIEAIPAGEARKIVLTQSSDWNAYRSKLAGVAAQTPVRESAARQDSTGKITAKVEDSAAPKAEPKDQLKVSPTEKTVAKPGAAEKRSEEDQIAKEKAINEAKQRMVSLEKNVADLQKLVELKDQNLAELQKQAAEKNAPPVAAVVPPPRPEPVVAAVEKPVEVKPPEAKPEDLKPASAPEPAPVEAPKPVVVPKPKPLPVPPAPEEEAGLVDDLLANPLALGGGVGILALLAGYFVVRRRRASLGEAPLSLGSSLSQQFSSLTANSIFRSTGGQSVDTSHGPAQTDFSQAGPGSIDTDEVDPVAEADVYMAYGRDVQAEEILLEARQKDPKRYAIHLKLLEIYANRKDLKQFEILATDLYSETGGVGADWEKAQAMGLKIDPGNPLYGMEQSSAPAAPAPNADATVLVAAQAMKQTITMPGELSQLAELASAADAPALPVADLTSLDFDLGQDDDAVPSSPESTPATLEEYSLQLPDPVDGAALDFDLAAEHPAQPHAGADLSHEALDFDFPEAPVVASTPVPAPVAAQPAPAGAGNALADLDFDLGDEPEADEVVQFPSHAAPADEVASDDDLGVRFDVSMTESTFLGQTMPEASSFDMSAIDLDLEEQPMLTMPSAPAVPQGETESPLPDLPDLSFDDIESSAAVTSNFETVQAQTQISPHSEEEPDVEEVSDFSIAQGETLVNPQFGEDHDLPEASSVVSSEDVTTKLDLAKAYEEMGDFEGARELLQEVLTEGDAAQRAKAEAALAKIGP